MVTDKTPPHKRIARAEQSAAEWKMKAIERREESEYLKEKLNILEAQLAKFSEFNKTSSDLKNQIDLLTKELHKADQIIVSLQEQLKKKRF